MEKQEVEHIVRGVLQDYQINLDIADVEHKVREVLDKLLNPRFDIHIEDSYASDGFSTIPHTENLTVEQVGNFILSGGDWNFQITPHGKSPEVEGMVLASGRASHSDHNVAY